MSRLLRKEREIGRLLVEGKTDVYAIAELMKWHGFDFDSRPAGVPEIQACGNDDGIFRALPVVLKTYRRVGVVVDADTTAEGRWQRVAELVAPFKIDLGMITENGCGITIRSDVSTFGLWIMPGLRKNGYLEDFLGSLVDASDATWAHALDATSKAADLGAKFSVTHAAKARLHTWLAWQEAPGSTFGVAFQQRWLQTHCEDAMKFAEWFAQVFPEGAGTFNPPFPPLK